MKYRVSTMKSGSFAGLYATHPLPARPAARCVQCRVVSCVVCDVCGVCRVCGVGRVACAAWVVPSWPLLWAGGMVLPEGRRSATRQPGGAKLRFSLP
jgi:hypothetical protein